SSQTTTAIRCAASPNVSTLSESPAAVSISSTSSGSSSPLNAWIRPPCTFAPRFAIAALPELAGTIFNPEGAVTITSSSPHSPAITCSRLRRARSPSTTSTFPRPRSASSSSTRRPRRHGAVPRFPATFVLPTPPLPPEIAMTLIGCAARDSPAAWSKPPLGTGELRGVEPLAELVGAEPLRELVLGELRRAIARAPHRGLHQPDPLRARDVQILRHALAVGNVDDGQTALDRK